MAHVTTTTKKLKNRDCVNKIRYGSPKLRKVLRENCRQRMREKRSQLFNSHRNLEPSSSHVQDALIEIVHQEFKTVMTLDWDDDTCLTVKEIDEPLSLEKAIELENEIIQEQEQWLFQEYEKMYQDEMNSLATYADSDDKEIFCPTCQKAILIEENNCVTCVFCGLKLTGHTMQEVKYLVSENVNVHASKCTKVPMFILIPDNNNINLFIICHDCSTLSLIC